MYFIKNLRFFGLLYVVCCMLCVVGLVEFIEFIGFIGFVGLIGLIEFVRIVGIVPVKQRTKRVNGINWDRILGLESPASQPPNFPHSNNLSRATSQSSQRE